MTTKDKLKKIWRDAWRPPDRRPPWAWCEDNINSIPYSPIPGRFRSANSPWMRAPMEALADSRIRLVCLVAAIQSGKTSVGELGLTHIISNHPGPTLWLDQTDDDAKDQSESRLQKLFDECPPVQALYHDNRHKRKIATVHFSNGMTLWVLGAKNKTNLQRRSIRWLIGDETWRWPTGHMAEAEARVTAFGWLGKCLFMSQGGFEDDDTHRKFETTNMQEWMFACPECGTVQPFLWENVEWSKDAKDDLGEWDFQRVRDTTIMHCASCNHYFEDSDRMRRELNLTGRYVVTNPRAPKENAGFHWNALASMSWGKLAELYLRAKKAARSGDLSLIQQFFQKRLALPWKEYNDDFKMEIAASEYLKGEPWDQEAGINSKGKIVGPGELRTCPLRIMTVDCQLDHLFVVIRSWAFDGSSRLMWNEKVLTFTDIDTLQEQYNIHPNLVFIDAGHATYNVYRECAKRGWIALMGDKRATFNHKTKKHKSFQRFYSPRRMVVLTKGSRCSMFYWSNLNIKDTLVRIKRNQDPANGPVWLVPADIDDDYLGQMESERRVKKGDKWIWEQIGSRPNHYWDCESMQMAAATMLKLIGREAVQDSSTNDEDPPEEAGDAGEGED
jgi:phage terminase large subunit GpA-like protein